MAAKNKVTYILGAGASAKSNALPTVARYSDALIQCASYLQVAKFDHNYKVFIDDMCKDMLELAELGKNENTVDSYANWCFINNKYDELQKIKRTLAFFFSVEQYVLGKFDPRYRQFITTILSHNPPQKQFVFPDNIKIINWNYDFQVQLACNRHGLKENFSFNNSDSKSIGKHQPCIVHYFPTMANDPSAKHNYSMVHMNGIADYHYSPYFNKILHWAMNGRLSKASVRSNLLDDLLAIIVGDWDVKPLFNFAFEKDENGLAIDERIQIAERMIEDTDFLVAIGYSFATTNDFVDRRLFKAINKNETLKTIYLQTKDELATDLRARFELPESVKIIPIRSLESFHEATEHLYER